MSAHGYGPYTRGCRCDVCKAAKADYMRARRAAAREKAQTADQGRIRPGTRRFRSSAYVKHGTFFAYEEHGCRCLPCTDARTEKRTAERRRQIDRQAVT